MLNSRVEQWHTAMLDLLQAVNLSQPDHLPQLVNSVTEQLADAVITYLVDYEQRTLRSFTGQAGDTDARPVEGSVAGHPPPIVVAQTGPAATVEGGRRTPLGIAGDNVSAGEYQLRPNDRLLLYTDGIIESRDPGGEFFGIDRLTQFAARPVDSRESTPETARRVNQAVLDLHPGPPADDATILIMEWSTSAADKTLP